jgi:hypothetical protein
VTTPLVQGRIIIAPIVDPQGRNPKNRPAVVITPTADILPGGAVQVVAVSSQTDRAANAVCVPLPWQRPNGHPRTRLNEQCAAICTWLVDVPISDILGYKGITPDKSLFEILRIVRDLRKNPGRTPAADPSPDPPPA